MATDHNFRIKNGLEVGGQLIVDSNGQLVVSAAGSNLEFPDNTKLFFGTGSDASVFYDGSHEYKDQKKALETVLPLTDDTFILVIDDANFKDVVESAKQFISDNKLTSLYENQLLTTKYEDATSW